MRDIVINRLKDDTKVLRERYTNWINMWFPAPRKEYKLSEHHAEWCRIMAGTYDK